MTHLNNEGRLSPVLEPAAKDWGGRSLEAGPTLWPVHHKTFWF